VIEELKGYKRFITKVLEIILIIHNYLKCNVLLSFMCCCADFLPPDFFPKGLPLQTGFSLIE